MAFPEISPENSPVTFSIGVSAVPRKKNHDVSLEKFREFGVPLRKEGAIVRGGSVAKPKAKRKGGNKK